MPRVRRNGAGRACVAPLESRSLSRKLEGDAAKAPHSKLFDERSRRVEAVKFAAAAEHPAPATKCFQIEFFAALARAKRAPRDILLDDVLHINRGLRQHSAQGELPSGSLVLDARFQDSGSIK